MLYGLNSLKSRKSFYIFYKTIFSTAFLREYCKQSKPRNPYDVLGLENTCSSKDIKKAYIKLCKELHPDKKPDDVTQHKKFVELNNAYTALINESSRKQVDDFLRNPFKDDGVSNLHKAYYYKSTYGGFTEAEEKDIPWYEREAYRKEYEEYYYRQKKNAHLTNFENQSSILIGCFVLIVIGCALYYSAYSYGKIVLKRADKRSKKIKENCEDLHQNAEKRRKEILESFKK